MAGAFSSTTLSNDSSRIPFLNGDNYKDWKERILLILGCLDLDLALRVEEPPLPTELSTLTEKTSYERWERSNRLSLMLIKSHIGKSIRESIPDSTKVKDYLQSIEEKFTSSDKVLASTLMKDLSSMKYDGTSGVREHIMGMRDIAAQLKSLEIEISESFLVHFILISFPPQIGPFKISYNTHKDKWSINELLIMCVQEEGRLKQEGLERVHLVSHGKGQFKNWHKGESSSSDKGKNKKLSVKKTDNKDKCFSCKKTGHFKKDCKKFQAWLEKKGFSKPKESDGK